MSFCLFCEKTKEDVLLIETATNSLLIGNKCYEFSYIFNDILPFTSFTESNYCICEQCKNLIIDFFVFKKNIRIEQNPFKKLISSQVEDFLNNPEIRIEDVKVIRALNSITIQYCNDTSKPAADDIECQSVDMQEIVCLSEALTCGKCDKAESTMEDLEAHEFLKHSSFGIQLDNLRMSLDGEECYECSFCNEQYGKTDMYLHLLESHSYEVYFQVNDALDIATNEIDFQAINSYLLYIMDNLKGTYRTPLNEENKRYFYQIYGDYEEDNFIAEEKEVQYAYEASEADEKEQFCEEAKEELVTSDKMEIDEDKEWIRLEIAKSKCLVIENNRQRAIYRCTVCSHISNSPPGLRYHLIMKHLKNRKELQEDQKNSEPQALQYSHLTHVQVNANKNICPECCLKFKDQRALNIHEKCHELFSVIAYYAIYPSCNTCSIKFLNEELLQHHLAKHEADENLLEPITLPLGAVPQQGKPLKTRDDDKQDINGDNLWKCGHCHKSFAKEEQCNFHLIMYHTTCFMCPIDKMEFSGYKSVSLYSHHLRNKHPELFPNLSFKCTLCKMEFSTIYNKLQHMKTCDRKQFQCDHCGKKYFKKGELLTHLKFVSGEVQFECGICQKKCISQSDLNIHYRSHTKDKPYKCSLCKKSFRTLAARSNHVEAHNTTLIFPCEICGKNYKQRQLYRRHVKTVHEKRSAKE